MNDFRVELGAYAGPLDLLLYLARVNEVDIVDISLATITEQYVHYLDLMDMLNMERGAEFLVMAATLMEIKSRTLVPVEDVMEEEDLEDPRLELIQQLIEYRKIKELAKDLDGMAAKQAKKFPRAVKKTVVEEEYSLDSLDMWDLVTAFDKLMKQVSIPTSRNIVDDDVPIRVYMDRLVATLKQSSPVRFSSLFDGIREKVKLIGIFLALLELGKQQRISVEQEGKFGEIHISYREAPETADEIADETPEKTPEKAVEETPEGNSGGTSIETFEETPEDAVLREQRP